MIVSTTCSITSRSILFSCRSIHVLEVKACSIRPRKQQVPSRLLYNSTTTSKLRVEKSTNKTFAKKRGLWEWWWNFSFPHDSHLDPFLIFRTTEIQMKEPPCVDAQPSFQNSIHRSFSLGYSSSALDQYKGSVNGTREIWIQPTKRRNLFFVPNAPWNDCSFSFSLSPSFSLQAPGKMHGYQAWKCQLITGNVTIGWTIHAQLV
jgi:hypothetical protein